MLGITRFLKPILPAFSSFPHLTTQMPSNLSQKFHPPPNQQTNLSHKLLALLNQCDSLQNFKQIHSQMLTSSINKHNHLLSKLIHLQDLPYASLLFSQIPQPNDYSYNVMIRAFTNTWHQFNSAVDWYYQMKLAGLRPNNFTYPFLLIACANLSSLGCGRIAHSSIFKVGVDSDGYISHSLITFYSKCGEVGFARQVFDEISERDVVSWNSMIAGYSRMGFAREAVGLFRRMRVAGFEPDEMTLVSVLGACGDLGDLELGKWVEGFVEGNGVKLNSFVGSSMIDMYGKCGDLESARRVFDSSPKREVVIWNAMITGYAQNGMSDEVIKLFYTMRNEGKDPDKITMVGVLSACASVGALELGMWVDEHATQKGLRHNIYVGTGLIDMYAKCGSLDRALSLFEDMPWRNVVCWNAMITALAVHGQAHEAVSLFNRMINGDPVVHPNDVTFIGVLSACVHSGLVEQGRKWFTSMGSAFGIIPKAEHYSCMVDLLARAGHLDEAWEFIKRMPEKPDAVTLGALLSACRNHKNIEVSERIINQLLELEPSNSGNYVISSKIFASSKRWDDSARMRGLMRERGVIKTPGCSWMELNNEIHEFHSGDGLHHRSREICEMITLLNEELNMEGYIPKVDIS